MYAIEVYLPLKDLEQDARRELARLLPEAETAHVAVTRLVEMGVPSQKILETAAAEQVDMIVIVVHGRTGLGHLVMGSVAERVVRTAPAPWSPSGRRGRARRPSHHVNLTGEHV